MCFERGEPAENVRVEALSLWRREGFLCLVYCFRTEKLASGSAVHKLLSCLKFVVFALDTKIWLTFFRA